MRQLRRHPYWAWSLAGVIALLAVAVSRPAAGQEAAPCNPSDDQVHLAGPTSLTIRHDEKLAMQYSFGSTRRVFTTSERRYDIDLGDADTPTLDGVEYLPVRFGEIERSNDGMTIPTSAFQGEARVVAGKEVHLRVCVDLSRLPAGTYETSISVNHPDVTHTPMPIRLSLQSASRWQTILTVVAGWAAGYAMLFLRSPETFRAALRSRRLWLSTVAGITASVSANLMTVLQDVDFGVGMADYLELFVATVAAFLLGEGVVGAAAGIRQFAEEIDDA